MRFALPSPLPERPSTVRRASAAALGALLTAALLGGCATEESSGDAGALAGAATAKPVKSRSITCTGDATSKPAASRLVSYSSLSGDTFAKREQRAGGKVLDLGRSTLSFRNFQTHAATWDGGVIGAHAAGIVGAGMSKTTIRMVPRSSTRRSTIPSTFPKTNQLSVLRLTGSATVLRGFTLKGTAQGHPYNGIRVEKVKGFRADHVRVWGSPGNDHQPPGETFAINNHRSDGARWSHIREDGKGVGATGLGVNTSRNVRICDAVMKNNPTGMGFAFWQSSGITCVDCRAYDNGFSGFNFERTSGEVALIRPAASGNRYDMRIASDQRSAKFRIVDPKLRGGVWTIWMPRTWYVRNKQKQSDVTLVVHGKKRNDLLRFRTY